MSDTDVNQPQDPQDEVTQPLIGSAISNSALVERNVDYEAMVENKVDQEAIVEKKVDYEATVEKKVDYEAPKIEIQAPDAKQQKMGAPKDEPSVGMPVMQGVPEQTVQMPTQAPPPQANMMQMQQPMMQMQQPMLMAPMSPMMGQTGQPGQPNMTASQEQMMQQQMMQQQQMFQQQMMMQMMAQQAATSPLNQRREPAPAQPIVVQQTSTPANNNNVVVTQGLGNNGPPQCPYCGRAGYPIQKQQYTGTAWCFCIILFLLGCWLCCCIPFCCEDGRKTNHCRFCNRQI